MLKRGGLHTPGSLVCVQLVEAERPENHGAGPLLLQPTRRHIRFPLRCRFGATRLMKASQGSRGPGKASCIAERCCLTSRSQPRLSHSCPGPGHSGPHRLDPGRRSFTRRSFRRSVLPIASGAVAITPMVLLKILATPGKSGLSHYSIDRPVPSPGGVPSRLISAIMGSLFQASAFSRWRHPPPSPAV